MVAQVAQYAIQMHMGNPQCFSQILLSKGTIIGRRCSMTDLMQPVAQLEKQMRGASQRIPLPHIDQMLCRDGQVAGQGPQNTFRQQW